MAGTRAMPALKQNRDFLREKDPLFNGKKLLLQLRVRIMEVSCKVLEGTTKVRRQDLQPERLHSQANVRNLRVEETLERRTQEVPGSPETDHHVDLERMTQQAISM